MTPRRAPPLLIPLLMAGLLNLTAPGATAQESLTLRKIKETGVIAIGYRDGSIPFSYLDDRQEPIGYSMDLCRRVVDAVKRRLGLDELQVKFVPVNSSTRGPMVTNNTIDLECGTTTNTVERQRHVAFAVTTFVAGSRFVTRRNSAIRSLKDLRGKQVVSTAGTTSIALLGALNATRALGMNILAGKDHLQSFHMVENNRASAFMMDDVLLYGLIAVAEDPSAFVVTGEPLSVEPYAIALRKSDPEFKLLVDNTLVGLFRSGEIVTLYRKWFESPIPSSKINLALPMNAALKKVIANPTDSGDPAVYR
jgi:glutamate/aspartate transport system substrate-binding protein